MLRLLGFLPLALLVSCAPTGTGSAGSQAVCRIGPDGGPLIAERGIGGTGQPTAVAERGIGGTGSPGQPQQLADRGIGGTGVVGVITGFASICVNNLEVAVDPAVMVQIDGHISPTDALRVGQVAVITASGETAALRALSVNVRHEVSGPIEATENGGQTLRIAGQTVSVGPDVWGNAQAAPGSWVAVSGLRRADGTIVATRIDDRSAGTVTLHGELISSGRGLRIGDLPIQLGHLHAPAGQNVVVSGRYERGALVVNAIAADPGAQDPGAYFDRGVNRLFVEQYVQGANSVVEFTRGGNGSFTPTGTRGLGGGPGRPAGRTSSDAGGPGSSGSERMPAPMPSRDVFRSQSADATGRPGQTGNGTPGFAGHAGRCGPSGGCGPGPGFGGAGVAGGMMPGAGSHP